jgi:hypothetical protein
MDMPAPPIAAGIPRRWQMGSPRRCEVNYLIGDVRVNVRQSDLCEVLVSQQTAAEIHAESVGRNDTHTMTDGVCLLELYGYS